MIIFYYKTCVYIPIRQNIIILIIMLFSCVKDPYVFHCVSIIFLSSASNVLHLASE